MSVCGVNESTITGSIFDLVTKTGSYLSYSVFELISTFKPQAIFIELHKKGVAYSGTRFVDIQDMRTDPFAEKLFEMRLKEIYNEHPWIQDDLTAEQFIALFPLEYKNRKPRDLNMPSEYDLDRETFLKVLVAFKQSFG